MVAKNNNNETQFTLRIDVDVLESVKKLAIEDGRSITKEIEFILREYSKTRK